MATKGDVDTTTGRTPWDALAVFLARLGTVGSIVAGILVAAYFGYKEVATAQLRADQELRDSLAQAQAQLVENTQKMGDVSAQVIDNVNSMLELSRQVDTEIEATRAELANAHSELRSAREEAEVVRRDAAIEAADLESRAMALLQEVESQRASQQTEAQAARIKIEELQIEIEALQIEIEELQLFNDGLNSTIAGLQSERRQMAVLIDELKENEPSGTAELVSLTNSEVRTSLWRFATDPGSKEARDGLQDLVGTDYSEFEKEWEVDGVGFATWFYSDPVSSIRFVYGFLDIGEFGPGAYVRLGFEQGRLARIETRETLRLFYIPKSKDWYDAWICAFAIQGDGAVKASYAEDSGPSYWNRLSLTQEFWSARALVQSNHGIIYGADEYSRFRVASVDDVHEWFPDHFAEWSQTSDRLGRPARNLAMMERSRGFDAATLPGIDKLEEISNEIASQVIEFLNSAVGKELPLLREAAPGLDEDEFGAIAAMALSGGTELDQARMVSDFLDPEAEQRVELLFRVGEDPSLRSTGRMVFEMAQSKWVLREFETPF